MEGNGNPENGFITSIGILKLIKSTWIQQPGMDPVSSGMIQFTGITLRERVSHGS
jgi:hypothetical protein